MKIKSLLLTESIDTSWVVTHVWPFIKTLSNEIATQLTNQINQEIIKSRREELGYHPTANNEMIFKKQFPRRKWKFKNFSPNKFNEDNIKDFWSWEDNIDSHIDSILSTHGDNAFRKSFKTMAAIITKYVQYYISRKYGQTISVFGQNYDVEDVKIQLILKKNVKHGGEYLDPTHIKVFVNREAFKKALIGFINDIMDDEPPIHSKFENFIKTHILETLTHELSHFEQSIRMKNRSTFPSLTHLSKGGRGDHSSVSNPTRHASDRYEIGAFAASHVARLVADRTKGINDPKQFNNAIDQLSEELRNPSNNTGTMQHMKKVLQSKIGQDKEIENAWKHFLKLSYIQLQKYKKEIHE